MNQYGIQMYSPNGNGTSDIIFTTKYPFAKLDTQNDVSFQNIKLIFNNDLPNPDGTVVTKLTTTVYSFPHGYKQIPTVWALFQRTGSSTQDGSQPERYSAYAYEGAIIAAASSADTANFATFFVEADATNIYLQVQKTYVAIYGAAVNLVGYSLLIRIYDFVEPMNP